MSSFRTGPFGRLARAAWAALVAWTLLSISDPRGPATFRDPHVLSEVSAWILHAVMLLVFAAFVGAIVPTFAPGANGQRAQAGALSALAAYVVVTATIGVATGGSAWPYALSGAVWTFDVLMLALELVAFGLAIALGTPGCEMGVWRELADRLRGRPLSNTTGLACVVGLQRIDEWEAKRRAARIGRVGSRS